MSNNPPGRGIQILEYIITTIESDFGIPFTKEGIQKKLNSGGINKTINEDVEVNLGN